jgi:hypothetical protein
MGFEFTGNFFIEQIVQKKGEFFLKKLEKLVEFILEEEFFPQIFQIFCAASRPPPTKKKEKKIVIKISMLPNYTTTVA